LNVFTDNLPFNTANIAAFLGHKLTNIDEMHSQREDLSRATLEETKSEYIMPAYKMECVLLISDDYQLQQVS